MATSSSALSSAGSTGTATFNGTSQYAGDLQQAINQAVAIASIPLTQLENNVSTLQSQGSELTTLQTDFTSVQTAIQQLASSTGSGSLAASVSDNTVASVSVDTTAAATAGTYTLKVISAGSETTTLSNSSLPAVSDPTQSSISSSSSFTLTVGSSTYTITPASNTLSALVTSINSANAGVSATLVNTGSPSSPNYQLSLQSNTLGDETIQLNDGTQNLLSVLSDGAPAQYQIDGQPSTPISSSSPTVTLAPGVTADLLQAGQTTVTVAPDASASSSALSALVTAYNSALSELNTNHGTAGGALTGQSVLLQLQQQLQSLTEYSSGSGDVQSLADLGVTFNSSGQLTFDQTTFDNAETNDPDSVSSFLGSATGGGFLENATNVLSGLLNTNNGVFTETQSSYTNQINADNSEITATQARITTMQNNLTAQMSAADSMIASLESQDTYYTTLFSDENTDSNANSNG